MIPLARPAMESGEAAQVAPARGGSYRAIIGSSALMGGSTVVNLLVGIVRTKVMVLLLGPAGFGLMSAYLTLVELARAVAQMGLSAAGVRQIAAAAATGDERTIARTVVVLRRTSLACGVAGGLLLAACAAPLSVVTFGDASRAGAIALLGVAVFFFVVAAGQGALLQGLRRIRELSLLAVIGGVAGTVAGIPLVWAWGARGVAPTLVVVAATASLASWWYARRVRTGRPDFAPGEFARESGALLKLGFAFMASGLLTMGASAAARLLVLRQDGLAAAGVYQAAWTIGGIYIGLVLQAMAVDFYPRLVAAIKDEAQANRLVNEQAQASLLLALPGVLATLTLAPLLVPLLYSADFAEASATLRWICLGMALRVVGWPLGFIVVAQNRRAMFLGIEGAWTALNVALTALGVRQFGVGGAGMAFFASYVGYVALLTPLVRRATGFRWSRANLVLGALSAAAIGGVFTTFVLASTTTAVAVGVVVTAAASIACLRRLVELVEPDRLPRFVRLLTGRGTPA